MTNDSASPEKTVVIVGASNNPQRASYTLLRRLLLRGGFKAVPVHPALTEIEGQPVASSLARVDARPDIVSLYIGPDKSGGLEGELIQLKPGKVIFNPGAENPLLEDRLNRAGIKTENACSLILLAQHQL